MTTAHAGYNWSDLREQPARALVIGDVFLSGLSAFTAYVTSRDGRVRPAIGCEPPDGTAWTVTAREGDTVTALASDGRTQTQDIPDRARVLAVLIKE